MTLRRGTADNWPVDEFSAAGTSKQRYIYEHAPVYAAEVRFHLAILTGV